MLLLSGFSAASRARGFQRIPMTHCRARMILMTQEENTKTRNDFILIGGIMRFSVRLIKRAPRFDD
jgi:hypothetical protein